jgi:tRNA threonylcarbamoyladenosine biosynthesis protein TsaE
MKYIISQNEKDTKQIGEQLAGFLEPKDVLALSGNLGTGKTTFIKGVAQGLKIDSNKVVSPTFTLLREYRGNIPLYHFDLYRLDYLEQVEFLGYEEYFYGDGVCCIEWADKIDELLPDRHLDISFKFIDNKTRKITLKGSSKRFNSIIKKVKL